MKEIQCYRVEDRPKYSEPLDVKTGREQRRERRAKLRKLKGN